MTLPTPPKLPLMVGVAPSLPRFLSLEKDFTTFDEQLRQAVVIARIPKEILDEKYDFQNVSFAKSPYPTRGEWVLKWVLDKLKSTDAMGNGGAARASIASWNVLSYLVAIVPVSSSAKLLGAAGYVTILQIALKECLSASSSVSEEKPETLVNGASNEEKETSSSRTTVNLQPLRKRKRDQEEIGRPDAVDRLIDKREHLTNILRAIAYSLYTVMKMVKNTKGAEEAVTNEQMKVVVQTNEPQASHLLALWFSALNISWGVLEETAFAENIQITPDAHAIYIQPILEVWRLRTPMASTVAGHSCTFSDSLVSVCALAATVNNSISAVSNRPDEAVRRSILHSLEKVIAANLFVPARLNFFSESRTLTVSTDAREEFSLQKLLYPLKMLILENRQTRELSLFDRVPPSVAIRALPFLLSVAIRCTPHTSSRRISAETPWLQTVFTELATCAGIALATNNAGSVQRSSLSLLVFQEMVQLVIDNKLPVESSLVLAIARNVSGLADKEVDDIQWSLVAQLQKIDSHVFVGAKIVDSLQEVNIPELLIQKLGLPESRLLSVKLPMILRAWTADDISVHSKKLQSLQSNTSTNIREIKESILSALIHAYASARNLDGLLDRWETQLCQCWDGEHLVKDESTLWNDGIMNLTLRSVFEGSFIAKQICQELDKHVGRLEILHSALKPQPITSKEGESTHQKDTSERAWLSQLSLEERKCLYATFVVLDGITGSLQNTTVVEELRKPLARLQRLYLSFLSNKTFRKSIFLRWTCSTLSITLTLLYPLATFEERENAAREFFSTLAGRLSKVVESSTVSSFTLSDDIEIFHLVVAFAGTVIDIAALHDSMRKGLEKMCLDCFEEGAERSVKKMVSNKNRKELRHSETQRKGISNLRILSYISYLIRSPGLLCVLSSDVRRVIFSSLYRHAFLEAFSTSVPEYAECVSYSELLDAMIQTVFGKLPHAIKSDLLAVIVENVGSSELKKLSAQQKHLALSFAWATLLKIPLSSLKRPQRELILDLTCELTDWKEVTTATLPLSLIVKLMEGPNFSAKIAQEPRVLWDIAASLDEGWQHNPTSEVLELFRAVVESILRHFLAIKNDRSQKYISGLIQAMQSTITTTYAFYRPSSLWLFRIAIAKEDIRAAIKLDTATQGLIHSYASILCTSFSHLGNNGSNQVEGTVKARNAALEEALLSSLADLPLEHGQKADCLHEIITEVDRDWTSRDLSKNPHLRSVARLKILIRYVADTHLIDKAVQLLGQELSPKDRKAVLALCEEHLASIDMSERNSVIQSLTKQEIWGVERLEIIRIALKYTAPPNKSDTINEPFALLANLCAQMKRTTDVRAFVILIRSISTILNSKPLLTTQHGLETLMSTLVVLLSPNSPSLPQNSAARIYMHISTVATTIISLHRTKLRGRYHLLSLLLQSLLACLFTHDSGRQQQHAPAHLPPWLSPKPGSSSSSSSSSKPLLPAAAGSAFARVLTTLCSPTVSSAGGHRARKKQRTADGASSSSSAAPLVDETARARAYAGQYVSGVVLRYCAEQLRGRMPMEVREAAMPGLWAAMEVMEKEAMRAMSAGMGSSERAVWKGLWDEWRRRGGGGRAG